MWENSRYFWVVLCKNHWFHIRKNLYFRHRILLAETDAITPRPAIDCCFATFTARCDECGKEYIYKLSEVLRFEQEPPESFTPHPLFRNEGTGANAARGSPETVAEEELETRIKFLIGPGGLRHLVYKEFNRKECPKCPQEPFTIPELASLAEASQSEVEEALRIMRSRYHATEASRGQWFVRT